jgi:hypothetical protein
VGDHVIYADALLELAVNDQLRGDLASARDSIEACIAIARGSEEPYLLAAALNAFARFEADAGALDRAMLLEQEALNISIAVGDDRGALGYRESIACTLRLMGRVEDAFRLSVELVPAFLELGEPVSLISVAEDHGAIVAELGDHALAARLLGAADSERATRRLPRSVPQEAEIGGAFRLAREALMPSRWRLEYDTGRAAGVETSLIRALRETPPPRGVS